MHITKVIILKKDPPLSDEAFGGLIRRASDEYRGRAVKMQRGAAENLLLGEALSRHMLCEYTGIAPQKLAFARGPHGKPFLRDYEHLHFNLSHSGIFVACALSPAPVGIDVQMLTPPRLNVAKRFFTDNEYNYILEENSAIRFCRVWTMKESYVKYLGSGISATPLHSFDALKLPAGMFHEIKLNRDALCQVCGAARYEVRVLKVYARDFLLSQQD